MRIFKKLTKEALETGLSADQVLVALVEGMGIIGDKFSAGKAYMPNMLMAAKAMSAGIAHLKPYFSSGEVKRKGPFVIGRKNKNGRTINAVLKWLTVEKTIIIKNWYSFSNSYNENNLICNWATMNLNVISKTLRIMKITAFILIVFSVDHINAQEKDRFAEIGNKPEAVRMKLLQTPLPQKLPDKHLQLTNDTDAAFTPMNIIDTQEKLQAELKIMREKYEPFLQNLAPPLVSTRIIQNLTIFDWRKETEKDRQDFSNTLSGGGSWEKVNVPHYGPPLGEAVTYYRTAFIVTEEMFKKGSVFLKFNGIDYIAQVFVNGTFVGAHEGIFAPFEFEITHHIHIGTNNLLVKVKNDFSMLGRIGVDGRSFDGNKLYAASGLGYDDAKEGWHACPAGMGIYQLVTLEARKTLHFNDVFVRPIGDSDTAEVWLELNNTQLENRSVRIRHSLYGQNFSKTIYDKAIYKPMTIQIPGIGDMAKSTDNVTKELLMGKGANFLKFKIIIPASRRWNNETPWLYQLQLELLDDEGTVIDTKSQQFGMRSFKMDTVNIPKGMMYLNNKPIRLRGANTMGAFQQSVFKKDWAQLIDDILLAKITNMNYIRMTQMPVQNEVYDYFDRLGLMTQTDLPLFGVLRRNMFSEAIRQAGEMEKLVRSHPCNIMVTFINERFPNAEGAPQRNLDTYADFDRFFKAADQSVLINNPDRVIKAGDGDYDPPSPGLPDNHCYNGWYNGHGLGLGEMFKGYWIPVKPGWYYGCGEFGSEGLDPINTMKKYYPKSWLPENELAEKDWTPVKIPKAQTFDFHYMWFNLPHSVSGWVQASQEHQAMITRLTTEAFRRDNRMVSFAIHLFIDAFPSGWMKAIMDVDRQPKKAWFEYRQALEPLAVQLRTDRYQFFSGEHPAIEAWIVNDKNEVPANSIIRYQLESEGKIYLTGKAKADIKQNQSSFQGFIDIEAPEVKHRQDFTLRLSLFTQKGIPINETNIQLDIRPKPDILQRKVWVNGKEKAGKLATEMGLNIVPDMKKADVLLIDDMTLYTLHEKEIIKEISSGKILVLLELAQGNYDIAGSKVEVKNCQMGSYYFVSPQTNHPMVRDFIPDDFKFWYDGEKQVIRPIIDAMVKTKDWNDILKTGDVKWGGDAQAVLEKKVGKGFVRICQLTLSGRVNDNPSAYLFVQKMLQPTSNTHKISQ